MPKSRTYTIYIAEDDVWYGEKLQYQLSMNPDFSVTRFENGKELLHSLDKKPDLITIDYGLPDLQGDELYAAIRKKDLNVPVIVISAQNQIAVAVQLLKQGVADYIPKDDNTRDLLFNSIQRIRENQSLKEEVADLKNIIESRERLERSVIGQSAPLKRVLALVEKAAESTINVSISGETGTGKEVIANAIHNASERRNKNFVALNMAAIPEELVESELFGHEKGSFTGAFNQKKGKFEDANKGTIFLDEIAEMDLNIQSKILRVLQEREVVRIGGSERIKLDVRLIVSTHKDLAEEVEKGNFREDLYYRIIGLPIKLPPLRERGNDIILLANHFASLFANQNKTKPKKLATAAVNKLSEYHYPGNIRELKSIIDLACVLCEGNEITDRDIVFSTARGQQFVTGGNKTLKQYNCEIIAYYLKLHNNSVPKVAEILDMGKSTIYTMIKAGEIELNK